MELTAKPKHTTGVQFVVGKYVAREPHFDLNSFIFTTSTHFTFDPENEFIMIKFFF